ncbi:alpha-L-fucosidase [Friedmanniella endophytica]|uniref:alpha-L-fucosidase n=1 Tax=Microlunatus kandeliicorticis TaxID=1759536 RepID=A0A7W3IS11_9ACTN|nr:alpha-L-fucosidase [Microlunatus kandeliicorticis]MBA8794199.1 alpha-L-fucosidase [Microlunatus kandeliicorticis]
MAATEDPTLWSDLTRPLPDWFARARFGIFIHWGAYAVPAWAEPTGALGAVPDDEWFAHNPYAEWYFNTIRIEGSPAARRHAEVYGGAPYDDFLDAWRAERFDPAAWAELFAATGASYVVPTTKHHDGIALWDAPGTGRRNTVHRGPQRDLVGAIAEAVRAAGMRFGVYYSGGLDWSVSDFPPHRSGAEVGELRPRDAAYNAYALLHVRDLVDRYGPDVLWNDINWPDAGKRDGAWSLHELFSDFYARNPDGVVNDRWGIPYADYRTSEYEAGTENEEGAWENCRGIGFSFGYNQVEDEQSTLSGPQLSRYLGDVVSRGGRLLLNVGPTAAGEIPEIQQRSLRSFGRWHTAVRDLFATATPVIDGAVAPSEEPWTRWLQTPDGELVALVDQTDRPDGVTVAVGGPWATGTARLLIGEGEATVTDGRLTVRTGALPDGPAVVAVSR